MANIISKLEAVLTLDNKQFLASLKVSETALKTFSANASKLTASFGASFTSLNTQVSGFSDTLKNVTALQQANTKLQVKAGARAKTSSIGARTAADAKSTTRAINDINKAASRVGSAFSSIGPSISKFGSLMSKATKATSRFRAGSKDAASTSISGSKAIAGALGGITAKFSGLGKAFKNILAFKGLTAGLGKAEAGLGGVTKALYALIGTRFLKFIGGAIKSVWDLAKATGQLSFRAGVAAGQYTNIWRAVTNLNRATSTKPPPPIFGIAKGSKVDFSANKAWYQVKRRNIDSVSRAQDRGTIATNKLSGAWSKFKTAGAGFGKTLAIGTAALAAFGLAAVVAGIGLSKFTITFKNAQKAFSRFGGDNLLEGLRASVAGTVSDLKLMQQAISAINLNLRQQDLATYFEFATIRAAETGVSADYLVQSIVTGIGRESRLVLDNLGISLVAINKEIQKTGSFTEAANNIIKRELKASGTTALEVASGYDQMTTAFSNFSSAVLQSDVFYLFDKLAKDVADFVKFFTTIPEIREPIVVPGITKEALDAALEVLIRRKRELETKVRDLTTEDERTKYGFRDFNRQIGKDLSSEAQEEIQWINRQTAAIDKQLTKIEERNQATTGWLEDIDKGIKKLEGRREAIPKGDDLYEERVRAINVAIKAFEDQKEIILNWGIKDKDGTVKKAEQDLSGLLGKLYQLRDFLEEVRPSIKSTSLLADFNTLLEETNLKIDKLENFGVTEEVDIIPDGTISSLRIAIDHLTEYRDEILKNKDAIEKLNTTILTYQTLLDSLTTTGVEDIIPDGLLARLQALSDAWRKWMVEVAQTPEEINKAIMQINFLEGVIAELTESLKSASASSSAFQERTLDLSQAIGSAAASAFNTLSRAIADSVFSDKSGEEQLASWLGSLASLMVQFGSLLIAWGIASNPAVLSNPATAIVAGAALVAIGAGLAAYSSSITSSGGGGSSGNTGGTYSGGGGYDYDREIVLVARGQDLVAVLNRTNNYNGDNGP